MARRKKPNLSRLIQQERMVEVRSMRMERYRNYKKAREQAQEVSEVANDSTNDPVFETLYNIYEEIKNLSKVIKEKKCDGTEPVKRGGVTGVISGVTAAVTSKFVSVFKKQKDLSLIHI